MDNTTIELKECWHEGMDLLLYNPAPAMANLSEH